MWKDRSIMCDQIDFAEISKIIQRFPAGKKAKKLKKIFRAIKGVQQE